jgi:hypothetical protein
MSPNPFSSLLHSRKFWLLILDTVISLTLYFAGKYADPSLAEDTKILIAALQPVFVAIIAAIAYEDAAASRAAIDYVDKTG